MCVLGLDTSNYTTSVAVLRGKEIFHQARLLDVEEGALGLRQSEALFQHVKRLPLIFAALRQQGALEGVQAVGASTRPREAEGSYMPCFLAGQSQGQTLAHTLGVPFFSFSHQQGHLAAASWGAGQPELLTAPFLAWHLSGGTTELLHVLPGEMGPVARRLGGSTDLSAGQLIDRTGLLLGLRFPAGRALDALAAECEGEPPFAIGLRGLDFSLSGMENQAKARFDRGDCPKSIASFVLETVAAAVLRVTRAAAAQYGVLPVLFSGGVAASRVLRGRMAPAAGIFCPPEYATDNAVGVAVLTRLALEKELL